MCNIKWFCHTFFYNYSYTDCIVIRHLNYGQRTDRQHFDEEQQHVI